MLAADLFAGAGGLTVAAKALGFEVVFANDIAPWAATTYRYNNPEVQFYTEPIEELTADRIMRDTGLRPGDLDVLIGGPPCQGFSINAPDRSLDDPRNHLFKEYARIVQALKPRYLLIENVPGLLSLAGGSVVRLIQDVFSACGYSLHYHVVQAAYYGVPQDRWRLSILGAKIGFDVPEFPAPTHKARVRANFTDGKRWTLTEIEMMGLPDATTVEEAISDLPGLENGEGEEVSPLPLPTRPLTAYQENIRRGTSSLYNHVAPRLSMVNLERLTYLRTPADNWTSLPETLLPSGMKKARKGDHTRRYSRIDPKGLSGTIMTKCDPHWGSFFHYRDNRALTVREAARLQSFPDWYRFIGPRVEQYRQVGNAVPPLLGQALLSGIKRMAESRSIEEKVIAL